MVSYAGKPKTTPEETSYMERLCQLPCCICLPGEQISRTQVHHITCGGRRLGSLYCLPLCETHHQHVHLLKAGVEKELWQQVNETLGITDRSWPTSKIVSRRSV